MKIALYIEGVTEQIVLTPQTDTEKAILRKLTSGEHKLMIYRGEFYACKGGWTRWAREFPGARSESPDESTILVLTERNADER